MPIKIKLSKPLPSGSGDITELYMREIGARELMRFRKSVVSVTLLPDGGQKMETDYELAGKYIAELCDVDEITLGSMSAKDFQLCLGHLLAQFAGEEVKN